MSNAFAQNAPPPLLSAAEAARLLGVSAKTLRNAVRRGELSSIRLCARTYIDRSTVEALRAQAAGTKPFSNHSKD